MSKTKTLLIVSIMLLYVGIALGTKLLVNSGYIAPLPPTPNDSLSNDTIYTQGFSKNLGDAKAYLNTNMVQNAHVNLYLALDDGNFTSDTNTNSEAASYYLLWNAIDRNRTAFDAELEFIQTYMQKNDTGYLMWRLNSTNEVDGDGANIASDADLRAIKALLVAEENWNDPKYTQMIDKIARGVEVVAVTDDGYLAPYGGGSAQSPWRANEVWLSYVDFTVIDELAKRRGEPWISMNEKMKNATLHAQIHNGLYNSELTMRRQYGNGVDGGVYSINSMWIMIRAAESEDKELRESAQKSLDFYKQKYAQEAALYARYGSNGDALSPDQAPWVYALVGRAAVALDDIDFANKMAKELVKFQSNETNLTGAIIEGEENNRRVGQFTMQESILMLQALEGND